MNAFCTIHNTNMFPSKFEDGKPYHFTGELRADGKKVSCHGEGLGKAVRNGNATDGQFNNVTREAIKQPDWDAIAEGKVRSLFIQAHIHRNGLVELNQEEEIALTKLVNLAMGDSRN